LKRKHKDAESPNSPKRQKNVKGKGIGMHAKQTESKNHEGHKKRANKSKGVNMDSEIDKGIEGSLSDEDKSDLENDYLVKSLRGKAKGVIDDEGVGNESSAEHAAEGSGSGSETDTPPQHESLAKSSKGQKKAKTIKVKVAPHDETAEQRNARTIFIGNLSVEVAQKKVRLDSSTNVHL
jgi:nucleolar protein 12